MPPVQEFDGDLMVIEESLHQTTVPTTIRDRVRVTRDLAVYGAFCYEFFAVSVYWAYTTVEMGLWTKFKELNPANPTPPGTLKPLVDWATKHKLLPTDLPAPFLTAIRNDLAHPKGYSHAVTPGMARDTFEILIHIVNHLWPIDLASSWSIDHE